MNRSPFPDTRPGQSSNSALPFYPAEYDPGNGAGLYVPPEFDQAQEIHPWEEVDRKMDLPPWFDLSSDFKPNPKDDPGIGPSDDGRSTRYVEGVSFRPNNRTSGGILFDNWSYEIGRVYVPKGCFGILYRIDTHLVSSVSGQTVVYNNPLDPFKFWRDSGGRNLHYFLRLERPTADITETIGAWPGAGGYLPGVPHIDLGGWDDLRFAWGNNNYPMRLMIPEDNYLKLYCAVSAKDWNPQPIASEYFDEIGGRLIALVANYRDNDRSTDAARRGW